MKISKEKRLQMKKMINASLVAIPTEKKVAYVNRLRNDGRVKDMRTRISWDIAHSALGNGFLISLYDDGANDRQCLESFGKEGWGAEISAGYG